MPANCTTSYGFATPVAGVQAEPGHQLTPGVIDHALLKGTSIDFNATAPGTGQAGPHGEAAVRFAATGPQP